ncbi:uncharacterized protein MONOS_17600 [Monocercomonoides exilis]|uniref:uncharacterized protein n=1 Tax=Monocercomonoides exilis TaxID=2049356 RepID=UPI003559BC2E|nr:hypothetical protein MONOS_17600 [Monocercomonoides exilis]
MLEEREEAEEGERGGKEGEENGEEDGRKEGSEGNEEKGGYPTAHREFVERIKESQGKLEEAIAPLVVEGLGLGRLRFVKAFERQATAFNRRTGEQKKKQKMDPGITSDGNSYGVKKDEEQMQMSKNDLAMFEESGIEGGSIDLEKEKEEEEEEKVDKDVKLIFKKCKGQKQKDEIILEVLEKWTQRK